MDAVAEILRSLRLQSALLARAEGAGNWAIECSPRPCALFHAIVDGRAWFRSGDTELQLSEGDVVLVCRGDAHVLADNLDTEPQAYGSFPVTQSGALPTLRAGSDGTRTSILCGSLTLRHAASEHLTSLLPPVIHLSHSDDLTAPWLEQSVQMLLADLSSDEPGRDVVVTRILETFFVHVLRSHFESRHDDSAGWLAGLSDPRIARALAHIHRDPSDGWTASELATRVGMSRSSFFSRFSELVGEPPVQYVTRWRMLAAADLLRGSEASLAEVADQVGYQSEGSFSRAFRRVIGASPGDYRRVS